MTELTKINPGSVKVTVARPLGRAASHGGNRAVEAVPPVVLDNETALGFLREKARTGGSGRGQSDLDDDGQFAGKRLPQYGRRLSGDHDSRIDRQEHSQYPAEGFRPLPSDHSVRSGAVNAGFATHVMAQSSDGPSRDPEFLRQQREERHSQSSEAYRRAGAEPLLYGRASQVVSVAI